MNNNSLKTKVKLSKISVNPWKSNMMKILECLFHEEATWASSRWQDYGVSAKDQEHIMREFNKHMGKVVVVPVSE